MLAKTYVLKEWSLVWAKKGKLETVGEEVGRKGSSSKGWEAGIRMAGQRPCRKWTCLGRKRNRRRKPERCLASKSLDWRGVGQEALLWMKGRTGLLPKSLWKFLSGGLGSRS